MKVLLDHNVPKRTITLLTSHEAKTARQMGWEELANGALLRAAAKDFEAVVSIDKKLRFQQNLNALPIAVVVLDVLTNSFASVKTLEAPLLSLLKSPVDRILYFIQRDGQIMRLGGPN